jgi:hypothetical protein
MPNFDEGQGRCNIKNVAEFDKWNDIGNVCQSIFIEEVEDIGNVCQSIFIEEVEAKAKLK